MQDQHVAPGPAPRDLVGEVAREGFATTPLLSPAEVGRLAAGYRDLTDETGFGCRPSTISPDPEYRSAARDLVRAALEPRVRALLPEHRCVVAAFVPKEVGTGSEMAMHRDWSTCDERRFSPIEVWVPLTEASADDGALVVVPRSHLGAEPRRGSGVPAALGDQADVGGTPVPVVVPVGSAICFHPALVHGSGPNLGTALRLAVISTFQPVGAPLRHFERRADGTLATHAVEADFYTSDHRTGEPVVGTLLGVEPPGRDPQFQ